jgi:hypothetical protein
MPLRRGEWVAAARSLGMGSVPTGTWGRVVKVGFFGGYDVDFGRGRVLHDVSRDALRAGGGSWWALRRQRRWSLN